MQHIEGREEREGIIKLEICLRSAVAAAAAASGNKFQLSPPPRQQQQHIAELT